MNTESAFAVGMPQDRLARLAARQAFVDLKQDFMVAAAGLPGLRGDWLRLKVRSAEDVPALRRLTTMLFDALGGDEADASSVRHSLHMGLASLYGDSVNASYNNSHFDALSARTLVSTRPSNAAHR